MADVTVPFGDNPSETAILLLAAAEESDQHTNRSVRTGDGGFIVPEELAKAAGVNYESDEEAEPEPEPPPAKKTATKRATKK